MNNFLLLKSILEHTWRLLRLFSTSNRKSEPQTSPAALRRRRLWAQASEDQRVQRLSPPRASKWRLLNCFNEEIIKNRYSLKNIWEAVFCLQFFKLKRNTRFVSILTSTCAASASSHLFSLFFRKTHFRPINYRLAPIICPRRILIQNNSFVVSFSKSRLAKEASSFYRHSNRYFSRFPKLESSFWHFLKYLFSTCVDNGSLILICTLVRISKINHSSETQQ